MPAKSHGMTNTRCYTSWSEMWTRCTNPNRRNYRWYGARGITVCQRWKTFENFLADMGEPSAGESLDRVDGNGNYEPSNCRWAGRLVQHNNRSNNRHITVAGESLTIAQAARNCTVPYRTLLMRVNRGWSGDDAVSIQPDIRFRAHQR